MLRMIKVIACISLYLCCITLANERCEIHFLNCHPGNWGALTVHPLNLSGRYTTQLVLSKHGKTVYCCTLPEQYITPETHLCFPYLCDSENLKARINFISNKGVTSVEAGDIKPVASDAAISLWLGNNCPNNFTHLSIKALPDMEVVFNGINQIVINVSPQELEKLSQAQIMTLTRYTQRGGTLILTNHEAFALWLKLSGASSQSPAAQRNTAGIQEQRMRNGIVIGIDSKEGSAGLNHKHIRRIIDRKTRLNTHSKNQLIQPRLYKAIGNYPAPPQLNADEILIIGGVWLAVCAAVILTAKPRLSLLVVCIISAGVFLLLPSYARENYEIRYFIFGSYQTSDYEISRYTCATSSTPIATASPPSYQLAAPLFYDYSELNNSQISVAQDQYHRWITTVNNLTPHARRLPVIFRSLINEIDYSSISKPKQPGEQGHISDDPMMKLFEELYNPPEGYRLKTKRALDMIISGEWVLDLDAIKSKMK